jgi:hypothetical protein
MRGTHEGPPEIPDNRERTELPDDEEGAPN